MRDNGQIFTNIDGQSVTTTATLPPGESPFLDLQAPSDTITAANRAGFRPVTQRSSPRCRILASSEIFDSAGIATVALLPNPVIPVNLNRSATPFGLFGVSTGQTERFSVTNVSPRTQPADPCRTQIEFVDAQGQAAVNVDGNPVQSEVALAPPMGAGEIRQFRPHGMVVGPDGLLYVGSVPDRGGQILRFNFETGAFIDVFVNSTGGINALNRPDALVFGSDGKLYVITFQVSAGDTNKILVFAGLGSAQPGTLIDQIALDAVAWGAISFHRCIRSDDEGRPTGGRTK